MKFSRRTKRVVLGFSALGLTVFFLFLASVRYSVAVRDQKRYEEERAQLRPRVPDVVRVEERTVSQARRYAADLRPWMEADVPAEVSGRVVETFVEPGEKVEAGQALVRLDDTLAKIAVEQAKTKADETKRLLAEAAKLIQSRAISETAYQMQAAAARADQMVLAEATERLNRHVVRAPFAGTVNERLVDRGDAVNVNQPVATVLDLQRLRVRFAVSESDLAAFPTGKEIGLTLPSHPGILLHPKIDFCSVSADPATRLFRVEAVLENKGAGLPGGLQGVVRSEVRQFEGVPFVPVRAVRFSGRKSLVWEDAGEGEPVLSEVVVGPEIDGFYPVFEGLRVGDKVQIR